MFEKQLLVFFLCKSVKKARNQKNRFTCSCFSQGKYSCSKSCIFSSCFTIFATQFIF